jgi:hypothetical protein
MERLEAVTDDAAKAARERDELADEIGTQLAECVEQAVTEQGTNVETAGESPSDGTFRFAARLDRAAMVAALTSTLPDGFAVSHVNTDGTLTVEWTGSGRTPSKRDHDAILKAIINEETVTKEYGLIESVPTREQVLARAAELGVSRDTAADRLDRLATLDMVDIDDGYVYPDKNFSRI